MLEKLLRQVVWTSLLAISCSAVNRTVPRDERELCFAVERNGVDFSICLEGFNGNDLEQIADVKKFAQTELGLLPSPNYLMFKDPPRTLYTLVVTSSTSSPLDPPKVITPETAGNNCDLSIPPLRLVSEIDDLKDEEVCYRMLGYDIFLKTTPNIGNGSNINREFMRYSWLDRAALICHEDLHNTDDQNERDQMHIRLKESRAQWVGLVGAKEYFRFRGDWVNYQAAEETYHRWLKNSQEVNSAIETIDELYKKNNPKTAEREREILLSLGSNMTKAELIEKYSYTKFFPMLDQVYVKLGRDHRKMMEVIFGTPDTESQATKYFQAKLR